jgi:hypothetical protein
MMAAIAIGYDFETTRQDPPVEPWTIDLRDHEWAAQTLEVRLAPLGLPSAAERRAEYRVVVDVETDRGHVEMPLPLRAEKVGSNGSSSYLVTGTQYQLTVTFEIDAEGGQIHWQLNPGGRDAAGRAAVIDLLIALSGRGVVALTDPEFGALAQMRLSGQPLDDSLLEERRFLTDILVIEGWSGRRLPLPDEIDAESGGLIAELTYWMRTRRMSVRFVGEISALTTSPVDGADELRLHETAEYNLFGVWVPLGRLNYNVPVRTLSATREGDCWRTWFMPTTPEVTATITPPHGHTSIRRVRAADAGELPKAFASHESRRRQRARAAARDLVSGSTEHTREDDAIRDDIRRRWPT